MGSSVSYQVLSLMASTPFGGVRRSLSSLFAAGYIINLGFGRDLLIMSRLAIGSLVSPSVWGVIDLLLFSSFRS